MTDLKDWITFAMSMAGFIGGAIFWYNGKIQKTYAAERDFKHLRTNQEQMLQLFNIVSDELDDIKKVDDSTYENTRDIDIKLMALASQLTETKALTLAICNRLEGLAARVEGGNSGVIHRRS